MFNGIKHSIIYSVNIFVKQMPTSKSSGIVQLKEDLLTFMKQIKTYKKLHDELCVQMKRRVKIT